MKTTVHSKLYSSLFALLFAMAAGAQTYTTQADGNWSSPATWVGGQVPSRIIGSGMVVNINHDVTADLSDDLVVDGKLQITGDTLRFASAFGKKTILNATGIITIKNGGYLQDLSQRKCNLEINGGRLVVENSLLQVSKDFLSGAGSRRKFLNTTVQVGEKWEVTGTSASRAIDTVQASSISISQAASGDYTNKAYSTLRVANARITVGDGDFRNDGNADITVLTGATSNYGFNLLRVKKNLDNVGLWDARIDQHCIDGSITGSNMAAIDLTRSEDCSVPTTGSNAAAPELVFRNPTLVSGVANTQGAVYRFANITSGIDAEVKLVKFSRNDIVMNNVDLTGLGWDKAFQPQFGLPGLVQPNQNWYVDFEMTFYKTGTNQKQRMAKVDMTALDVDGDGLSIREYAQFENPSNIMYSTVNYLTNQSAGLAGQTFTCATDNVATLLTPCTACGGDGKTGLWNIDDCTACDASGLVHAGCNHAFEGVNGSTITGPVENFVNIDTLSTQVMATYQYVDKDRIKFRYGARSGSVASNGAGVRLNSLWFRQFSMAPQQILPVKLSVFSATLNKKDVILNWVGTEENFSHYVLQRSTDGKNYSDVALIFTAGNGQVQNYKYKDANVTSATNTVFYRLQMVDKTQEFRYSDVKVIRLGEQGDALVLATYPNPAQNEVRVTLPKAWQHQPVVIELYTASGVRVQQKTFGAAGQTENLNLQTLNRGIYLVKAVCNGQVAQQQIVKN